MLTGPGSPGCVAASLGLKQSSHLQLPVAVNLSGRAVTEGSPENARSWVTDVTGRSGSQDKSWSTAATGRPGWPPGSHDLGACPWLVPRFDDARIWGASHFLASFVMISCPCHDPHPGLAQQPDPGVSARWVAHKWGLSSGTPGAGQRPGGPGMRGRGRPSNSPVAPPELLPQPLVFIWATVHTSWRVRCCVSHGLCSTRRQPLRSCKVRPALFSAASYPPSALQGPAVRALTASDELSGRARGTLVWERDKQGRGHTDVSVCICLYIYIYINK